MRVSENTVLWIVILLYELPFIMTALIVLCTITDVIDQGWASPPVAYRFLAGLGIFTLVATMNTVAAKEFENHRIYKVSLGCIYVAITIALGYIGYYIFSILHH